MVAEEDQVKVAMISMDSQIIDASDHPDDDLVKEVYAHFGLCMYLAQVFETGLINILTALETASSKIPTRQTFNALYAKHESLTFGNLMKALSVHGVLPADLEEEIRQLKAERDHLAHRFFRDHYLDFITIGGCHFMIERLEARRNRFAALDKRVSQFQAEAIAKIGGIDSKQFSKMMEQAMAEILEEARSRYSSKVAKDQT